MIATYFWWCVLPLIHQASFARHSCWSFFQERNRSLVCEVFSGVFMFLLWAIKRHNNSVKFEFILSVMENWFVWIIAFISCSEGVWIESLHKLQCHSYNCTMSSMKTGDFRCALCEAVHRCHFWHAKLFLLFMIYVNLA